MKSVLIIGMGKFGHYLCYNMCKYGNEIMIIDIDESKVESDAPYVTSTLIADCTKKEVLEKIGVDNFDYCFVCIGNNFQSSLEITSLLKEMGAKRVISRSTRDVHTKFLLRNGADEVIHPDKDTAIRVAKEMSLDNLFDYIELDDDYSIGEILAPASWNGKTLKELDIRARYQVNIIGYKGEDKKFRMIHSADYKINKSEHLMVMAETKKLDKLIQG